MINRFLVADSGGTKTDWALVERGVIVQRLETRSYHPKFISNNFYNDENFFWQDKGDLKCLPLYFFGSGCLNEQANKKMDETLKLIGFESVKVYSDLHGAAYALYGKESGNCAILGTGSVFFKKKGNNIETIKGGLGYILGDEGGGYNFGKMLLFKLLNNDLSHQLQQKLFDIIGDRNEIIGKVYSEDGQTFVSSLAKKISALNSKEIKDLHLANFQLFTEKYLKGIGGEKIKVVGSYANYHADILKQALDEYNISLIGLVERPIDSLTEYVYSTGGMI